MKNFIAVLCAAIALNSPAQVRNPEAIITETQRRPEVLTVLPNPETIITENPRRSNDDELTRTLENQLNIELGPAAHDLQVQASQGIVTLSGTLDNLLARDDALQTARSASGVLQVIDRLQVQAPVRADAALSQNLQSAWRENPGTRELPLRASAENGAVTLQGATRSNDERRLAAQVAQGVAGVQSIDNRISVQPLTRRSDQELVSDILHLFQTDQMLGSSPIGVQVLHGRVILTGSVSTLAEKERANQQALSAGASSVDASQLQVAPPPEPSPQPPKNKAPQVVPPVPDPALEDKPPPDTTLLRDVQKEIRGDPQLRGAHLLFNVQQAQVNLSGTVKNMDQRAALLNRATVPGIQGIDNSNLRVEEPPLQGLPPADRAFVAPPPPLLLLPTGRPSNPPLRSPPSMSDSDLDGAIQTALLYDARLGTATILPSVKTGVVTLTGSVETLAQKLAAAEDARQIKGVQNVQNDLVVRPPQQASDQAISDHLRAAFQRDSILQHTPMDFTVRDGTATLSGSADSNLARSRAADVAAGLPGIMAVENQLTLP